ncbi:MAG TPA: WD40 repeat domain-containing protein, partial [Fimbriimonas sp.]|nr:WD40 repeat domain-containing protein [Fimbriimonas sp.]
MLRSFALFGLFATAALSSAQFHAPSALWQIGAPNRASFAGAVSISRSGAYAIYTQQILSQESLSAAHVYDISTGALKWSLPCRAWGSFKPLVGFDAQDNLLFGLPQRGLWRQDIATREIRQLTTSDSPVSMLKVSPDGKKVAYFYANENGATVGLRLLSLESSVVLCSIPFVNGSQFFDFEWMPDSARVVVPGPNVYGLDGTQIVTRTNPGGTIVLSPDGTVIYSIISGWDGGVEVRASKANGNRIWTTPWPAGAAIEDALTPDGKYFLGL